MSNPIKVSVKTEFFAILLITLSFGTAVYFYSNFPLQVATHWNISGEVDGYSSRGIAAFLLPSMMLGMYLILLFAPYLDPGKAQYSDFSLFYHRLKDLIITFLFILSLLLGFNGLGYTMNIGVLVPIMVGALLAGIGSLLDKIKINCFVGVRTPWTMSSPAVWEKTHAVSGRIFFLAGALIAATVLVAEIWKIIFFFSAVILMIFILPAYSYFLYVKEKDQSSVEKK